MAGTVKGILQKPGKCSIKWKINRFFADCQQKGDYYDSPMFSIKYANEITKWYLKVYPKGDTQADIDYMSLFLCLENTNKTDMTGEFQFSFVDGKNKQTSRVTGGVLNLPSNLGWSNYESQSTIKDSKNNILIDDTLTILCEVTLYHPAGQVVTENLHGCDEWQDKIGNRVDNFEALLESGNFTDVTFNIQGRNINTHKGILSCCSPVFKAMFEHEMKENKQNSVDITDIEYDILKELFRFIYSGKVNNIEKIAADLLIAADKYQITELKALCERTLYESVTVENAAEYLKLTDICDTIHLKKLLIEFVATHYKDVDKMSGFGDLNSKLMHQIIQAIAKQG